ncbi:MAG: hypothetical protein LBE13_03375 [Bacteroidales bacterium]|jgi:hypothetical protein|nr:hypothetical protein [Bacteroidales bacterium]
MELDILRDVSKEMIVTIIMAILTVLWIVVRNHVKNALWIFKGFRKVGIKCVVRSRIKALEKIWEDLKQSSEIMVLNYKGYSLLREKNYHETLLCKLLREGRIPQIKFLLLDPNETSIIQKRRTVLSENIQFASTTEDSGEDIKATIKTLKDINENHDINTVCQCKLFREELKWSLIFSNNYILVSFYPQKQTAYNSAAMIIYRNSLLGDSFGLYFNEIWGKSIKAYSYEA